MDKRVTKDLSYIISRLANKIAQTKRHLSNTNKSIKIIIMTSYCRRCACLPYFECQIISNARLISKEKITS